LLLAAGHKLTSFALVLAGLQAAVAAAIGLIAMRAKPAPPPADALG
jgi:hypothetical protein